MSTSPVMNSMCCRLSSLLLVLVGSILLAPTDLPAQEDRVSVKAEINPRQAYIGDKLRFTLTIVTDSATAIDSIPVGETIGDFEILERDYLVSGVGSRSLEHKMVFDLASYTIGLLWIPQIPIRLIQDDGTVSELKTDSLNVVIMSVASGDSLIDIRGLKPPVYFGGQFQWLYAIAAAIALAAVLVWIWRRRKKSQALEETKPVDTRPPWVIAEEALRRLRESDLLATEQFKPFYLRLTDILRAYIEPRFGVDARDRTTSELRAVLTRISLDPQLHDLLFELLDSADLVKFAKFRPSVNQAEADFQKGWQFVQNSSQMRRAEVSSV